MSLEQRTRDYYDSGGTALPEGISLPEEAEYAVRPVYSFAYRAPRIFVVSSGTSARAVGFIAEDYLSNIKEIKDVFLRSAPNYYNPLAASYALKGSVKSYRDMAPHIAFIAETYIDHIAEMFVSCRPIPTSALVSELTFPSGGTSLPERRSRESAVAFSLRAEQREKNKTAIRLLETWLSEEADVDSQAASLKETITTLNTDRLHSRKLFS